MKPTLLELTPDETRARVLELGGKAFHAKVIRTAVFEKGILDYEGITSLSKGVREMLSEEMPILRGREVDRSHAKDGTTKLLIEFPVEGGKNALIETVHIPSHDDDKGATLCVSTQVGCPVACPFCASGRLGLERNLSKAEIIEQYLRGRAVGPLSRSVVMGIGEPLLNLEALTTALQVVREEIGIGARKITVSTVGFPDRLDKLGKTNPGFQLAISLHTPFDDQRAILVPAMAKVPVGDVLRAGDQWFKDTGRQITYEYVVLGGLNDTREHSERLAARLRGRRCTVNLIPYNPVDGDRFQRPSRDDVEEFAEELREAGVVTTIRWSRGLDSDAACGQLRLHAAQ
ncbi:MAG: 23S rRNA (adenine2503-C2)-methyltransferase [Bacteroidia bacterium]